MAAHRLGRAHARQIAVRAQLLGRPRPTDLAEVVRQLTLLQLDPTAAIAPSADLVAWSRLGPSYRPSQRKRALEQERTLVEFGAMVRPMSDMGLHLAGAKTRPSREGVGWAWTVEGPGSPSPRMSRTLLDPRSRSHGG